MNILLVYSDHPGTLGKYWKKTLSKNHQVTSCGPALNNNSTHEIVINKNIIDIPKLIKLLPANRKPHLILQIDSPCWIFLKGLEKINIKTSFYTGDLIFKIDPFKTYLKLFDYVFVAIESYLPILQKHSIFNSFYIPTACDPSLHRNLKTSRKIDVGFVGTINNIHNPKRTFLLNELKKHVNISIHSNMYGYEMVKFYNKCKIVINPNVTLGPNMRTFEAMACGSLVLQSNNAILTSKYFKDKKDFIFYSSSQDAVKKIKYLLKHPNIISKMTDSSQQKTRKYHTYSLRAKEFISIISTHPPKIKSDKYNFYFKEAIKKSVNKNLLYHFIQQINALNYRITMPIWYLALILQRLKTFKIIS